MKPFILKEFYSPNAFEKLMNKIPQKNILIEINNLFAQEKLSDLSNENIKAFQNKYSVSNPTSKFHSEFIELLRDFLISNLGNLLSDDNNFESARKFQKVLGISDVDFIKEYQTIATEKFTKRAEEILIVSNKWEEEEKIKIEQIRTQFGIGEKIADQIVTDCRGAIVKNYVNQMIADSRVSPQEIETFEKLQKDLDIEVSMNDESIKALGKYKNLWIIENGELPIVEANIILQKNECCYIQCKAKLYENRTVTKRVSYGGPTFRMKIVKGIYYRAGNLGVARQTEDIKTLIDEGILYITSKRILFNGSRQNKTYKYNQIIDLVPYNDGVEIVKDSGKSPTFYTFDADGEVVTGTIARVIKETQQ